MIELTIAISIILIIASISVLINPDYIFRFLRNNKDRNYIYVLAILVRVLIGFLLIRMADHSLYPLPIKFLGFVSLGAAMLLLLIRRENFLKLLSWVLSQSRLTGRIGGILGITFGGFLLVAFT